jgi:hypothetical protein
LAALVGVEDFRLAKPRQSFFKCLDTKGRVHRIREPPGKNAGTADTCNEVMTVATKTISLLRSFGGYL